MMEAALVEAALEVSGAGLSGRLDGSAVGLGAAGGSGGGAAGACWSCATAVVTASAAAFWALAITVRM